MQVTGGFCTPRCSAGSEECPLSFLAQEARAYGQSRGVIPFSCAYLAADASTRGRTIACSDAIQSVSTIHCLPSPLLELHAPHPPHGRGTRG